MTVRCCMLFVVLAALVAGCDPDRVAEREAREAQEQATLDSLNTAAEAEAAAMVDSVAEALAADSSPELDSTGAWNFNEDEVAVTEEEVEELSPEDWSRLAQDTVQVRNVHFDQAALDAYLSDPDLDYDRERHEERLWWTRFMRWLNDRLNDLFGSKGGRLVFDNIEWIILAIAVLTVLWFMRKRLFGGVFGMDAQRARQVTEMEEDIAELDLDKLLREAEQHEDWRLALRYHWLKVLRKLVDEGRIRWQPRSTDADYLAQLKDPALRATFSELSFIFKWVWYGDAPMDRTRYQRLRPVFEAAHSSAPAAPAQRA